MDTPLEIYLRRVIEQQPVCLTRIAADGTFLAVNDAALSLFGATQLEDLLDSSMLRLVVAEQRQACQAFIERISGGGRGSLEVEIDALRGSRHAVQINGVSVTESPDGTPSALCTIHDIERRRKLERALIEGASREEAQAAALRSAQQKLDQDRTGQSERLADAERRAQQAEDGERTIREQLASDRPRYEAALLDLKRQYESNVAELRQSTRAVEQALAEVTSRAEAGQSALAEQDVRLREALDGAETARAALAARGLSDSTERAARDAELESAWRAARAGQAAAALSSDLDRLLVRASEDCRAVLATLPHDSGTVTTVERVLVATLHAASLVRRIRREAVGSAGTPAAAVIRPLAPHLEGLLSPEITFRALIPPSDTRVELSTEQLEALVTMLAANQRAMMVAGGDVALEIADVHVDEACARERGTSPGKYLLIALHAAGPGVDAGLSDVLFNRPADASAWIGAGGGLFAALQLVRSTGGHGWMTREGLDSIAVEFYLPAIEPVRTEVTA